MLTDRDYQLLSNYLDDALNASERADLETRLNTERELRHELEALRTTVTLLKGLPTRKAPRNFTLDARPAARRSWFSPVLVSALSAAAAVFLIGFGLLSLTTSQNAAPLASSAVDQAGAALLPTATSLQKTSDGGILGTSTTEKPVAPPSPLNLASQAQAEAQSGAGGETNATEADQTQQFGQVQSPAQPGNLTREASGIAAVPLSAQTTPTAATADTVLAPSVQNDALQEYNTQASEESSPGASNQAAIAPTQVGPSERTSDTPTAARTATPQPTSTLSAPPVTPTVTLQTPAIAAPPTAAIPVLSLGLGVALLGTAVFFYIVSRRNR
jgi:hypothetical protein